ncbi:TIGR01244 family phosphatase [Stappia sp. GBMRC 2046]|uniref:TIGR01244 family phosphatase n=1 Tax=Stappia sediminis TaxID=2692190 RepID=A0A7X3LTA4_9HYPH|nr:TIGR01244 family sulfur transferase [Stappia sediminis]MXN64691.1 TIGR01244 family phosphatase [Stappia sediminis]
MDIRRLTAEVAVSPQIGVEDLEAIKAAGFRTIINNRPDGEEAGQPEAADVEQAARALGLDFRFMPVISGGVTEGDGDDFAALLDEVEKPVLAYCRTGTRCTALWALARSLQKDAPNDILSTALDAGYQLEGLRPVLEKRSAG